MQAENPFYILGLAPDCSWQDIEREGQKLLGMLTLGISTAMVYETPLGPQTRSHEQVRAAMAELRDPERRILHEIWAALPADCSKLVGSHEQTNSQYSLPLPSAFAVFGWK